MDTRYPRLLPVLFLAVLLGALDVAIVGPAMPELKRFFQINDRLLVWIFSIYILFNLIGTPIMAYFSNLLGRRTVFLADIGLFGLGSCTVALAPDFTWVLIGRAVQGFGAGGIYPIASAVIGDVFPPERRGGALGLLGAALGAALMTGPVVAGVLLLANWRWLFLFSLPLVAYVLIQGARLLPSHPVSRISAFDWPGMLMLSLFLPCLAIGLNQIQTTQVLSSLASARVWPFLAASALLLFALIRVESRAKDPILHPNLFGSRQLRLVYGLAWGTGLGESCLAFVPMLAVLALRLPASSASFLMLPGVAALAVGSLVVGHWLHRFGSKHIILSGALLLAAGMILLAWFPQIIGLFILAGILIGGGLSAVAGATPGYIILNETAAEDRSVAQGIVNLFTSNGLLIGSVLVGAAAYSQNNTLNGYTLAYWGGAVVAGLIFFGALGLKGYEDEHNGSSGGPHSEREEAIGDRG